MPTNIDNIIFAVLCLISTRPLLTFLGATDETWRYTRSYLLIMATGAPIVLLNHSIGGMLRGEGLIKVGMIGGVISTLANIALDPLFILVFGLGVSGAAIATVLGNLLAICYYFFYRVRHREECVIELKPRYAKRLRELGGVLSLGLPNAISSILSGLAGTFSNRLLVGYGTAAIAAMAAASKGVMIVTRIQMGICIGIQPLLAYCFGAKDWSRLSGIIRRLLFLTITLGTVFSLIIFIGRDAVVGLFLREEDAKLLGVRLMTYLLISGPLIGIYYLASNLLQAIGNAPAASVTSALRQGLLLIPLLYILSGFFGLTGLAFASPTADLLAVTITGALAVHYYRKYKPLSHQPHPLHHLL